MKRYIVKHDRDEATHAGFHWNLFEVDTDDPHDRVFIGFGSWETCITHAVGLAELRHRTGLRPQ